MTQADLDAGSFTNAAGASGTSPGNTPVNSPPASVTVPAAQSAALSLTKTASPTTYGAAGQVISYTLVATNNSNVTLTSVSISDPKLGTPSCTPSQPVTLAPGASLTCTGTYTIQAGDLNGSGTGTVVNTATASGSGPQNQPVSATASATVHQVLTTPTAQIAPTSTTCATFAAGTAPNLSTEQYSLKKGAISQVNPGVFFYHSAITAPAASFVLTVKQANTSGWPVKLSPQTMGQIVLYNAQCSKAAGTTVSYNAQTGTATINVTGATPGATYYTGIKDEVGAMIGTIPPTPATQYGFQTFINNALIITSTASIDIVPKH